MEKITHKQSEFIKDICYRLDLDFDLFDSTKQEANEFIRKHLEEYNNLPTLKQLDYINKICRYISAKFEGKTKQEASDFIKKYQRDYIIKQDEFYNYLYGNNSRSDYEIEDYCGIPPWEVFSPYDI